MYRRFQTILIEGHVDHYIDLFDGLADETSEEVMTEVRSILNAFRALSNFESENPDSELKIPHFEGFDGNEETSHYNYARFLIEDLGRYGEQKDAELDSDAHMIPRYSVIIDRWRKRESREQLNQEDVRYIVDELDD